MCLLGRSSVDDIMDAIPIALAAPFRFGHHPIRRSRLR
jgi:hypothetical protein